MLCKMKKETAALNGMPYAGNPHVRFDEGEVASEKPRRGSLLYMTKQMLAGLAAVAAFGAEAALSAKSYIQDGLAVQFDGIENIGFGQHNNLATQWKDLVGPQTFNLPTGDNAWSFSENGLHTVRANGVSLSNNSALNTAVANANFTVECAFNKEKETPVSSKGYKNKICVLYLLRDSNYPFGTINASAYGFSPIGKGHEGALNASVSGAASVGQHSLSCVQDGTNWAVRVDGAYEKIGSVASLGTPSFRHGFKFNQGYYADYGLDGYYHSLRVYTRSLTEAEVAVNRAVDQVRFFGAEPDDLTLPDGWRFAGSGDEVTIERRVTVAAAPAAGGTVKIDDGGARTSVDIWMEKDTKELMTLTAMPADGYVFLGWVGKDVTDAQMMENPLTIEIGSDVKASYRETSGGEPRTYSYVGGANGLWSNGANWRDATGAGGVPVAGDAVTIPAGKSVLVDESTAQSASLEILGTLTASNWETCVWADVIRIGNGGTVTCAGPFTGESGTNRVWLKCVDFNLAEGGKIAMDGKGFSGGLVNQAKGYGPGTINEQGQYGCSHGGFGGHCYGNGKYPLLPYGSAEQPEEPGSGGKAGWGGACAGGGVVRIEATGCVTVNGSILASGGSSKDCSKGTDGTFDNPGSGGSVWISCATFAGTNGVIRAIGGGGADPRAPNYLYGTDYRVTRNAGGGRIAIHYGAGQLAEDVQNVEVSTAAGLCTGQKETYATMDRYRSGGDCGTVWFSDTKLLDATLGKGLSGQVAFVTNYVYSGDLDWVKGHVRFAAPGANVTIAGSLTMTDGNSRLEVGGCEYAIRTAFLDIYGGRKINRLTVDGDVSLLNGARLDIRSAGMEEDSDFENWGGLVTVDGALHIASNSSVYAWCDVVRCTAPRFVVGTLTVDEGGLMSSEARGGAGASDNTQFPVTVKTIYGYSPMGHVASKAPYYTQAGQHLGYGGKGTGYQSWSNPELYDTGDGQYRPQHAGTGGGASGYGDGGAGGGVIFVESAGAIVVNGEINVDGSQTWLAGSGLRAHEGSGSGGTIFLSGKTFSGGVSARLTACGGKGVVEKSNFDKTATQFGGAGAGGCIAVWTGAEYPGKMSSRRVSVATASDVFLGVAVANGGERFSPEDLTDEVPNYAKGAAGSVWFCDVREKGGLMLLFR